MILLEEIKKLRELEQQAIPCKLKIYPSEDAEIDSLLLKQLHDLAPAMLAALSMIQEGDAKDLSWVAEFFEADCEPEGDRIAAVIRRYEKMAALMEKEEQ